VTPFATPPQTTSQNGDTSQQAAAVAQASGTSAGNVAQTTAQTAAATTTTTTNSSPLAAATTAHSAAVPVATSAPASNPFLAPGETIGDWIGSGGWLGTGMNNANITTILKQTLQAYFGVGLASFATSLGQQLTFPPGQVPAFPMPAGGALPPAAAAGLRDAIWPQMGGMGLGNGGVPVSAGLGQAGTLGRLSVPVSWPGVTPAQAEAVQLVSSVRPAAPNSNALLSGVPMAGAGAGGLGRRGAGYTVRYGFRHAVMPRPPIGG
jgi:hypothetical protein